MSRPLLFLFALAGGTAVGNLYWAQPLLGAIARDLGVAESSTALLVTATQLGYALGIFLLVPLGDVTNRRRLIPLTMGVSSVALAGSSVAPNLVVLAVALVLVGLTTVTGQIIAPLVGDLADEARRGRTVAVVMSGVLTGILAARIASGLVAQLLGWRAVFVVAAALTFVLAVLLYFRVPEMAVKSRVGYGALLFSVIRLVVTEPQLRVSMMFGATSFGAFSMFWTALTLLLSLPPYHFSPAVIGLFGIAGLIGAVAAQNAGRLHDKGRSTPALGLAWGAAIVSWAAAGFGQSVLVVLVIAVVLLDAAAQTLLILNQARALGLSFETRSRLNTAYVTGNFLGGAAGSWAASVLWGIGGWNAVATAGAGVSLVALGVWGALRRSLAHEPAR